MSFKDDTFVRIARRRTRAEELVKLFEEHGGVKQIHVRPVPGGWALTNVCADGFAYTTNAREDRMLARYYAASG